MAKAYNERCIVLRHTKLGETDAIVTMLASDGSQVPAVAKGLRKPGNRIGARLELFCEADLLLHEGKSLDIVREVKTVATNAVIRDELERTASASVAAELVEKLGRDGVVLGERMYAMSAAALRATTDLPARQSVLIATAFSLRQMLRRALHQPFANAPPVAVPIKHVQAFDVGYGGALCDACLASGHLHDHRPAGGGLGRDAVASRPSRSSAKSRPTPRSSCSTSRICGCASMPVSTCAASPSSRPC